MDSFSFVAENVKCVASLKLKVVMTWGCDCESYISLSADLYCDLFSTVSLL